MPKKPTKKEEPKIQEVFDDDEDAASSSTDDDMPELEENEEGQEAGPGGKQSRQEKKCRKAVAKMGMKEVNDIVRVTVKRSKTVLFVISKPSVFRSPGSDTYIVFGEAKIEDLSAQAQAAAAQQFSGAAPEVSLQSSPGIAKIEEEPEGDIDETGVQQSDIDIVMDQAKCSRAKAVAALKANNNDVVEAIMAVQ